MEDREKDSKDGFRRLVELGAKLAGGAAGGAIGFFAAGPAGAALLGAGGVVAAEALEKIGTEVSERLLGPREKVRIGAVLGFSASKIQENIKTGKLPRTDGFFDKGTDDRSTAEEIIEATLLAAQRDHQEQKLQAYGTLLANIASDSSFDRSQANRLIREAESLSWRQLCILAISTGVYNGILRQTDYRGYDRYTPSLIFLLTEVTELYHRGLINIGGEVLFGPSDVNPSKMKLQGVGSHLYNLMELGKIPITELKPTLDLLAR